MPIIATTDTASLKQIGKLVSIAYDTDDLDDDTIAEDVFLGDANLRIQAAVPKWESLTDDALLRVKIATMKACAVNILAAYSRIRQEGADDLSESRDHLTPAQAIDRYEDDIRRDVGVLTGGNVSHGENKVSPRAVVV